MMRRKTIRKNVDGAIEERFTKFKVLIFEVLEENKMSIQNQLNNLYADEWYLSDPPAVTNGKVLIILTKDEWIETTHCPD